MKRFATLVILFAAVLCPAKAMLIPFYTMSELAHNPELADSIVLCEELELRVIEVPRQGWVEKRTYVRCRAVRVFKGTLIPGAEFEVIYHSLFRRSTTPREVYKNSDGTIYRIVEPDLFPPGRALVFLLDPARWPASAPQGHDHSLSMYYAATAKLMRSGEVFEFGQFEGNPGGLSLRKKRPEWVRLAPNQKYGEDELIADLLLSLEHETPPVYLLYPDMKPYRPNEGKIRWRLQVAAYVMANGLIIIAGIYILKRHRAATALRR